MKWRKLICLHGNEVYTIKCFETVYNHSIVWVLTLISPTFCQKSGWRVIHLRLKNSVDGDKFKPQRKNARGRHRIDKLCSNASDEVENVCSDCSDDTCGDGNSDDSLWFWGEIEVHNHKMLWLWGKNRAKNSWFATIILGFIQFLFWKKSILHIIYLYM